jgi:hypothetical protein
MSAEDAFLAALAQEREGGSNFRLALEAVGGSTRALAEELGVSQRTVQRWRNYDEGTGKQARSPDRSPQASELKAMADTQRDQRALDRLAEADDFEAEIEVDYIASGNPQDDGSRDAYSREPLNLRPAVALYRQGAPMAAVGAALRGAIADSYLLPAGVAVRDVNSFSLH